MFQTTTPFQDVQTDETRPQSAGTGRLLVPASIDGPTLAALMARGRQIRSQAVFDMAGRLGRAPARPFPRG